MTDDNDTITDAVIEVLDNDDHLHMWCLATAKTTTRQPLEYETDRITGQRIRDWHGKRICGELFRYVNWVSVGKHFRDELPAIESGE